MNPDTVSSWFPDHCEKTKLPLLNFHVLRHTHASILLAAGEDIKKISEAPGALLDTDYLRHLRSPNACPRQGTREAIRISPFMG